MALHLIKVSVGSSSVEDHLEWQKKNRIFHRKDNKKACFYHTTFHEPKRVVDLLRGGSLYWVIKNRIQARQKLLGFDKGHKEDGSPCCIMLLEPRMYYVKPFPYRSFQGWRYLEEDCAPPDLSQSSAKVISQLPEEMKRHLAELCLL